MRADTRPKVRVRAVKAPKGDVASSGGGYGLGRAKAGKKVIQRQVKDTKAAADLARKPVKVKHGGGLLATIVSPISAATTAAKGADTFLTKTLPAASSAAADFVASQVKGRTGIPAVDAHSLDLAKNAARDLVDLPANTITSTYLIGKKAAEGHLSQAVHMLADPIVHTIEHPVSSFEAHPLNTFLIGRGVKGAVGHGLGKTMRVVPSKTTRRLASVERAPRVLPGAKVTAPRQYSGDVLKKATQVAGERVKVRRGKPVDRMTAKDVKGRVNADVQAAKTVSSQKQAESGRRAKVALGKKPTAATSLAAQGITDVSRGDLAKYLDEIKAQAPSLNPADVKANAETQKLIERALKSHDPVAVRQAAEAYSKVAQGLEGQVVAHRLVNPKTAESTRLVGPAVRRLGVTAEAKRTATSTAKAGRETARRVKVRAAGDLRKADQGLAQAFANARVSVAMNKLSAGSRAAEREYSQAVRDLAKLNRQKRGQPYTVTNAAVVKAARDRVKAANAKLVQERARIRGVAPAETDALLKAIAVKDTARQARTKAVAGHQAARGQHVALKNAPYATPAGQPIGVPEIRAAMGTGATEPAFVSHQGIPPRAAAIPVKPPRVPTKENRTGSAVAHGTLDVHPMKLVEQAMGTTRLVEAAKARNQFIDQFGYRDRPANDVAGFKSGKQAENYATANDLHGKTGFRWAAVKREDGQFSLVPQDALSHLAKHETRVVQHPVLKGVTSQWRRNVLAFSPRWLTGNTLEAALRSLVAGAGPVSYITAHRAMSRMSPADLEQLKARTVAGGNYTMAGRVGTERHVDPEDLAGFAKAVYSLRQKPGVRHVVDAYNAYTHVVFKVVNGTLESQFQKAMLGRAIRSGPLMSNHVLGLSRKAVQEAAEGLKNTDTQFELGRQVDRMYGQYGKFSPNVRDAISQYTPFIAWTINAVNFLYNVLPRDHPVTTALLASANEATEAWRKKHGLFLDALGGTKGQLPAWLQGSVPGKDGSHLRLSRYTPFGLMTGGQGATPLGNLEGLLLPQLQEILKNVGGKNWQGKPLGKNDNTAVNLLAAASSFLEGQVPLASQAVRVSGVRLPNMSAGQKITPGVGNRAREQFDPFRFTPAKKVVGGSGGFDFSSAGAGASAAPKDFDFSSAR